MRKLLALTTLTALLTGCMTTNYVMPSGDDVDVRFGPRRDGETVVRHVNKEERQHYFLLGFVPYEKDFDVAKEARLKKGQTLVNTEIDTGMTGLDVALWTGIGLVTSGLAFIFWMPRTTTLMGDVVETGTKGAAPAKEAAKEATKPEKAAEPAPEAGEVIVLTGSYTQKTARDACAAKGARLARKAEVEAAYKDETLPHKGADAWTSDGKGSDGWTFNPSSGAPFLQDPGEKLAALCFKKKGT